MTTGQEESRVVSASRRIAAGPERIFELIADPAAQPGWDGNDNLAQAPEGQRVRRVGDVFAMMLTTGFVRENHVTEFEEGRRIAWTPAERGRRPPGHLWRWELSPAGPSGTLVTCTYDWTRLTDSKRLPRARATTPDRLRASLDRLAALAEGPVVREALERDVPGIARLHRDSWRRHYRGAFSDAFLDGGLDELMLAKWAGRLARPDRAARTIVSEADGTLAGFAHVILGDDPRWGSLLDNLHVAYGRKRGGIGTQLMAEVARAALDWSPSSGLYLWVLEQNASARAFYAARGGTRVERVRAESPNGDPAALSGTVMALRIAWPDPSTLLEPVGGGS